MLDTVRRVATPEGCEISLQVAGPVSRARAWLLDFLLRLVLWMLLASLLGFLGRFGSGLMMLGAFLLEWFYPVLFEVLWRGQTPGKHFCGLAVLHDDGTPVGWGASLIRNTLRFVDFLPLFYAAGFISMIVNRDGKRLGDLVAGTVVVYREELKTPAALADVADAEPPPFALTAPEQRALIEFSRRAPLLTPERVAELALVPAPLTAGLTAGEARARLLRIANFLLGRR